MSEEVTRVPDSQRKTLAKMASFDSPKLESIARALKGASPHLLPTKLAREIAKTSGIPFDESDEVLRVLVSMYLSMDVKAEPVGAFVDSVCKAAEDIGIKPESGSWDKFKPWLTGVLSNDEILGVTAKALDLSTSHKNLFCKARIITDYRPIFRHDPRSGPAAGLIQHQLKVSFHEDDSEDTRDFYVVMDRSDLDALRVAVERAVAKEDILKTSLKKGGLTVLAE